jgi:hypothetical protein
VSPGDRIADHTTDALVWGEVLAVHGDQVQVRLEDGRVCWRPARVLEADQPCRPDLIPGWRTLEAP